MSTPAKRGRPPRHPIDVLRTKIWFASLKKISKLPSGYAIEMAICPVRQAGKSDGNPRPRKFAAYAKGQRIPQRKGGKPGSVDLAEVRFPGSAALVGRQGVLRHPRQFHEGLAGLLSDLPACMETLAAALLFWRLAETIADAELRQQAIDSYLMLQPDLEALPELAGDLARELFQAIDTNFPHWVYSGARRDEIVVLTNELRTFRAGQALTRRDINLRIAELREGRAH